MHLRPLGEPPQQVGEALLHLLGVQGEQLLELVDDEQRLAVRLAATAATRSDATSGVGGSRAAVCSASASPARSGASACARPRERRAAPASHTRPPSPPAARHQTRPHEGGLARPGRPDHRQQLPLRSLRHSAATSSSRPKKRSASSSVKDASPGYGRRSSASCERRRPRRRLQRRLEREGQVARRRTAPPALLQAPLHDPRTAPADPRPEGELRRRPLQDRRSVASPSSRRNGRTPASSSYSTTPSEKRSARWSTGLPRACSGAM